MGLIFFFLLHLFIFTESFAEGGVDGGLGFGFGGEDSVKKIFRANKQSFNCEKDSVVVEK